MSADTRALRSAFRRTFGRDAEVLSEAPGRVNLIGEHTDYNEGLVLPVAIDRTVAVAAARRDDHSVRVRALDYGECDEFRLGAMEHADGWRDYVRGVAWALTDAGYALDGCDLAISGDVPPGGGLSSSAALEVAVAGAFAAVSGLDATPRDLALLSQRAENEFVGVPCGIMDQFAAALGRADHALLIDCRSLEVETIALPSADALAIVVLDSRVPRRLAETAYERRREECAEAARALGVPSLRDADVSLLEASAERLRADLYRRARHVITENERVLRAAQALRTRDLGTLGELMYESHGSLRDDFEVSTPELDTAVALAREAGALGARLTGAGFGGCTVNIARRNAVDAFRERLLAGYRERTGLNGEVYACRTGDGLRLSRA